MYTLLSVGELLGDFIGTHLANSLYDTAEFTRFQGGSPSNLALNMSKLGHKTALVSCLGNDSLGDYLLDQLKNTEIDLSYLVRDAHEPSSMVLVSRTTSTPDFIPYRGADKMILPQHLPEDLLASASIFHTTCWPLSKNPSQSTLLAAAKRVLELGNTLSLDLNYSPKVWPDKEEAHTVIREYLSYGALIKLSDDDAERFFGNIPKEKVIEILLSWGAKLICFTFGSKGSQVITATENVFQKAEAIEVKDATGAGDAFWSGFLSAYVDGHQAKNCAIAGVNMAAIKLQNIGPLKNQISKTDIYKF